MHLLPQNVLFPSLLLLFFSPFKETVHFRILSKQADHLSVCPVLLLPKPYHRNVHYHFTEQKRYKICIFVLKLLTEATLACDVLGAMVITDGHGAT